MYEYRAKVLDVVDGDTGDFLIDLGFSVSFQIRVRFADINAPELKSPDPATRAKAQAARARVLTLIPIGSDCILRTRKDSQENYGRYLATVYVTAADTVSVNQTLLNEGLAVKYV